MALQTRMGRALCPRSFYGCCQPIVLQTSHVAPHAVEVTPSSETHYVRQRHPLLVVHQFLPYSVVVESEELSALVLLQP